MFKNKSPGNRGQSSVENSLHGMANFLALIAAILVAPQIYDLTADTVYNYMLRTYGDASLATLGMWGWLFSTTAVIFFLSRAIFVLALMLITQRLLTFVL